MSTQKIQQRKGNMQPKYISDYIDILKIDNQKFNIVASHCGTGKTYWVTNDIQKHFPNVGYNEMLFVTSRSLIVEQQSKSINITKFNPFYKNTVKKWNGEIDDISQIDNKHIHIMTYDKIIEIIKSQNAEGFETLSKIKIIFFDECHTLFSDMFIRDMESLKVWIRDTLYTGTKTIIGLTATPNILHFYQREWGVATNRLNSNIITNYKAKKLYCTTFNTLHFLLANKNMHGKTIVMCYSIEDCYKLKSKIPNSCVLVSKSNTKKYMPEMEELRNYIIENESLPDTYIEVFKRDGKKKPIEYERRNLQVLITTSTLREGVNLNECSGVRNVAIAFTDELHISQWVGRCRYNIDNLIIAESFIRTDNYNKNSYLSKSRQEYRDFIKDINHTKWFNSIKHLVQHDITEVVKFVLSNKEELFTTYINQRWLVPDGTSGRNLDKYKIYKMEDKDEIINKVIEYQLIDDFESRITFNKCIRLLRDVLGYTVEDGRIVFNKKKCVYKIIIDHDNNSE
jgi:hypothetical protein